MLVKAGLVGLLYASFYRSLVVSNFGPSWLVVHDGAI